ncbi:MAG: hypothetical protein Q7J57_08045 [Gemmobacter sp.]|nr:hypothetical protein [Gemmobacter sp.]
MTNRLALILVLLVLGFLTLDQTFGWGFGLFLMSKFVDAIEWLSFWR